MPLNSPSTFWGMLEPQQKAEVIKRVGEEAKARYIKYRDVIKTGTGLDQIKGKAALDAYRARSPEVWARIQSQFPSDYQEMQKDWTTLEHFFATHPKQATAAQSQTPAARVGSELPLPSMDSGSQQSGGYT